VFSALKTEITNKMLTGIQGRSWKAFIIGISIVLALAVTFLVINFIDSGWLCSIITLVFGLFFVFFVVLQSPKKAIPARSYLRLKELDKKKYIDSPDANDSEKRYILYLFSFEDEDDNWLSVDEATFEDAEEGKLYYVAYYAGSKKAYACFDADKYVPGKHVRVLS